MINTNNVSHNRGIEVINSMTNYTYSDTFYKHICDEQSIYKECSFPQIINNSCGKSI